MAKEGTLKQVDFDLSDGRLGVARDRMHGLIHAYPDDLSLRTKLGGIYWQLGYPIEAGRFWFLDEPETDDQAIAIRAFLKSCNDDPTIVFKRIKLRCKPKYFDSPFAREKIEELIAICRKRNIQIPIYLLDDADEAATYQTRKSSTTKRDRFVLVGCALFVFGVVFFTWYGISAFLEKWFK